jgi:ATP-dependent DNA helicase RecG
MMPTVPMKRQLTMHLPPESETVEWKRSLGEWKEIVETCAAFATTRGGAVHIGIGPAGERVGVQIGKGTLEELANKIAQNTNPRQTPSIVTHDDAGKTVIEVSVPASRFKPVYAFDRPYRRSSRTNQRLSIEDATHIYLSSRGLTWDQTPVEGATLADIDPAAVRRFLQVARTERQWDVRADTPVKQVLRQVGLLVDDRVTVAAILLFGRNPQQFLPQAVLRCGRFKGTDAVHFLDMDAVQGNVIEQVERAMAFVKRNIRMGVEIRGLQREDVWEYPLDGLREALINAVCHRDYASTVNVQIRIFDDRLEIWNPGVLPDGMTVADLWKQHESRPRNQLVANAFFLIKYVEQFGTGIQRIVDDCRTHLKPEPDFEVHGQTFRAIFKPGRTGDLAMTGADLNERQRKALLFIRKNGGIQAGQYRKLAHIGQRQAVKDLNGLVARGLVVRTGGGRSVKYILSPGAVHE